MHYSRSKIKFFNYPRVQGVVARRGTQLGIYKWNGTFQYVEYHNKFNKNPTSPHLTHRTQFKSYTILFTKNLSKQVPPTKQIRRSKETENQQAISFLIVFTPTVRLRWACAAAVVKQDQIPYYHLRWKMFRSTKSFNGCSLKI